MAPDSTFSRPFLSFLLFSLLFTAAIASGCGHDHHNDHGHGHHHHHHHEEEIQTVPKLPEELAEEMDLVLEGFDHDRDRGHKHAHQHHEHHHHHHEIEEDMSHLGISYPIAKILASQSLLQCISLK
jgi:hypothetical protein